MRAHLAAALVLLLADSALADYVEVRRSTRIHSEATRTSEILDTVGPTTENPLVILYLDDTQPREGSYLRVYVPSVGDYGYVYKTAGRVYRDTKGKYEPYDRSAYRHWVDEDRNCLDARQEVLVRDEMAGKAKVERRGTKCMVAEGTWIDPYSGSTLSSPKTIDVDHMVPLKNAHESGGWAWSPERKKAYANYLGNGYHLLAVSASENRRKSDKGPDRYLPPNTAKRCDYVENFVAVKREWGLRITAAELQAVDGVLASCPGTLQPPVF